jgi:hypothetical protein
MEEKYSKKKFGFRNERKMYPNTQKYVDINTDLTAEQTLVVKHFKNV